MTIILDFNRTLYDPETGTLVPGALDLLSAAKALGASLHLISKREGGREDLLTSLGVEHYFDSVTFTEEKESVMKTLIQGAEGTVYVIGDYLHNEIRIGNRYNAKTIWLKRGKFKHLTPETPEDIPWRTIEELREAIRYVSG